MINDAEVSYCQNDPTLEALVSGDLLFTRVGMNVGDCAVIYDLENALYSDNTIKVTLKTLNPFFVGVYFNTKFGVKLVKRVAKGTAQPVVSRENFEHIKVPVPNVEISEKVEVLVKDAYRLSRQSAKLYPEAEQELLERMEWGKVKTDHILNYTPTSKDILSDERLDPEFYQPKFENMEKHLKKIGAVKLGDFCPMPSRGVQPQYDEKGEVSVINSKHLGPTEIDIDNAEKTTGAFYTDEINAKARIKKHDVLMYSTGAYVGRTNAFLHDKKALASNHVTIIRLDARVCDPNFLALFLNSPAGLMQTDQRASGSAQREIYPQEIAKYQVFISRDKNGKPDLAWQKKLAEKIIAANEAKKSAKQKLQEAKQLVEKEIEKMLKA